MKKSATFCCRLKLSDEDLQMRRAIAKRIASRLRKKATRDHKLCRLQLDPAEAARRRRTANKIGKHIAYHGIGYKDRRDWGG